MIGKPLQPLRAIRAGLGKADGDLQIASPQAVTAGSAVPGKMTGRVASATLRDIPQAGNDLASWMRSANRCHDHPTPQAMGGLAEEPCEAANSVPWAW